MCMGRYDTNDHPVKDLPGERGRVLFPGKDYSNSRIKDFLKVADYKEELIDRSTTPRMPWHDIHCFVEGETAQDLAFHFIEYWNHAKIDVEGTKNKHGKFLKPVKHLNDNLSHQRGRHIDGSIDDYADFYENENDGVIGKDELEYFVDDADEDLEPDRGALDYGKSNSHFLPN